MLSTKFDITDGTFKFKIRNPGALNINYFKVWDTNGNSWRMEWTANEFHDYFSILNEHGYIPVSRRWLGQAPGVHWWKGDEWRDITIIKTPDGWFSVYENGVLLPYAHANFEDAVTDATKLTLASNSILQMDSIEVYNNKYIHPETTIEYGTYPKWWRVGEITYGRLDPTDENGIIVSGKNVTLKQISDAIDDAEYITYDPSTHTTVLKTNLSLYDGSELTIDNEILIIDTSSQSLSINPKVGVTLRITDSTLTATDNPLIWNIASSVSQNVFDPDNTRNIVASSGTDRHNPVYDFRGNFIIENSTIDNTGNLFLDAPYEVTIRNVVFSNHSSIDYGDYTLRGAYENHNQKKRQSYGEKGLWIVPRMDLTAFVIENITFIQPKTDVSLKFIGGEWIQSATTICDSDLRGVDIIAMKALKYEYYVTYWDKNEKSTLALLNTLYDEGKLAIGGHVRLGGAYDYNEASILTKYYLDISVEDSEDNSISGSDISLISSSTSYPAENLYEYRDYISDAEGPGQGGVTNYGSTHAHNETYTGGVHTRWYNALPLSTAVTDSNGHTALPESDDPKNSIVLIDYVLTSDAGNLKKESLTYTLNANAPSGQSVFLSGISPDSTWYREDPHIPSYTITAIIPDNSTSGPSIIGFAPSEDNPFVPGSSKKFRVWTDEMLTTMEWYVDGVQVSSGSLEYDWSILEGSHTIHFEGACTNGAVMQSWSVTGKLQVPEEPKVPESSGSGTSYTPSATSFTSSIGESTNFIVDTDEQFTSTQWYFNGAAVASGTTSYTQNWDASGSFTVSFEGATDLGTATRTWNVVVSGSEYSAISVVPSASVVAPGETFSLDMYIDPKQPVTGAQLNMHYSTLASVTSVRDGGLFKVDGLTSTFQSGIIDNSAGVVRDVYSAVTGSGAVSTAGSMATVDMVAGASSGMLELTLSNVVLSDAYSNPAPYDITYASILVDTAPEFNAIPAISVEEESALTFAVSATDEDGDTLTYTSASMPQGATFDTSTGAFSWTPARGQAGTYSVEFEVTDGYLNDTANAAITVTSLNRAPVITLFEPASGSEFEEGQVIDISVVAEDPEGESLSYSLTINGVQVSSSASYQWVTDYSCAGTHTIGVTVSDGNSQASQTHTVTILDVHPRWDVNQDGVVNILDITHVGQNYGNTYSEDLPRWDVNQDCIVNVQDLSIVAAHFGETL
ncbi:putative Ig domain-containing protein [Methanolobus sp.]|uniref:putative Ig domain-containing protein n=1 Tax=Methanolobus sp. TaxID=1874737 RepID=UPI0025F35AB7|nr:putative Ig domain-containing protein [Methanolobus sp.]